MQKASVIAIIPARYASVRLPAKPLVDINGKPMIQHVYERVLQSTLVNRALVATDDARIASAVKGFGGESILTPAEIRSGSDRVAFAAKGLTADIIVNVQGDEPLIEPQMIDAAIDPLLGNRDCAVGTLVKEIGSSEELLNPNIVKVALDRDGNALYFSRSPIPFVRDAAAPDGWHMQHRFYKHIGLYVYRRDFLAEYASWEETPLERAEKLEQLRILEHGYRIHAVVTQFDSIPVDVAADVERVKFLLQRALTGIR